MDNERLPVETQVEVLQQMIEQWRRQRFASQISARVAGRLGDERMRAQAVLQMERAEGALIALKEELEAVGVAVGGNEPE